jgi:hypothetical protein
MEPGERRGACSVSLTLATMRSLRAAILGANGFMLGLKLLVIRAWARTDALIAAAIVPEVGGGE